jgi:hypothetical protein
VVKNDLLYVVVRTIYLQLKEGGNKQYQKTNKPKKKKKGKPAK